MSSHVWWSHVFVWSCVWQCMCHHMCALPCVCLCAVVCVWSHLSVCLMVTGWEDMCGHTCEVVCMFVCVWLHMPVGVCVRTLRMVHRFEEWFSLPLGITLTKMIRWQHPVETCPHILSLIFRHPHIRRMVLCLSVIDSHEPQLCPQEWQATGCVNCRCGNVSSGGRVWCRWTRWVVCSTIWST